MFGSPGIVTRTSIDQIVPWTRASLTDVFEKALAGDEEGSHIVTSMVHASFEDPIHLILGYMGEEDTDLTGGTMGAPHTPSDIAKILMLLLEAYLRHVFRAHFDPNGPMWNDSELQKRCFLDYLLAYQDLRCEHGVAFEDLSGEQTLPAGFRLTT